MQYAIPYLLLILYYGILAVWYYHTDNATKRCGIVWLCAIAYILFFGFRGFCFYDWNSYFPGFQSIPTNYTEALFNERWYEPGFTFLMVTCKKIYNDYHFFILICCIINTILFIRFCIKYIENIPLAFIIFLSMGGLTISTDLLRNSLAIMIFMNSLSFIESRCIIRYYIAIILAISFHISAILFLPLYFIIRKDWGKWMYLSAFVFGNIIIIFHIPVLNSLISIMTIFLDPTTKEHIDEYTSLVPSASFQISIGYIERLLTGGLVFIFYDNLKELRKNCIFINCILLYFIMFFVFSEFRTISVRLSMLFSFAYIPIWIDLLYCFKYNNNRKLFITFIFIYSIFKVLSSTKTVIYNYDNILIETDTYNERKVIFDKNFSE